MFHKFIKTFTNHLTDYFDFKEDFNDYGVDDLKSVTIKGIPMLVHRFMFMRFV